MQDYVFIKFTDDLTGKFHKAMYVWKYMELRLIYHKLQSNVLIWKSGVD